MKEQDLWDAMKRAQAAQDRGLRMTRVETGLTATGVSDVTYVSQHCNGWIELKVSSTWRDDAKIVLQCPFKLDQLSWLSLHHNPANHLVSWLLVGVTRGGAWHRYLLLPPTAAAKLIEGRGSATTDELRKVAGARVVCALTDVLCNIAGVKGGAEHGAKRKG